MTPTDLQAEREKWDKVSATYQEAIEPLEAALAGEIGAALAPWLTPGATLLEAGCGSGHLSAVLARLGYAVTLLDFSPAALEAARRVFANCGLAARCLEGNLFDLEAAGAPRADCVWNSGVLEHYQAEEMVQALRQMAAVSGRYVATLVPNGRSVLYRAFRHWARREGRWQWGEENLIETMVPFYEQAGLEVLCETWAGRGFIEYFAGEVSAGSPEFPTLISEMLASGALPADQNYLILTLGRVAETGGGGAAGAFDPQALRLEEKNRAIARLMEKLGDREQLLQRAERALAEGRREHQAGAEGLRSEVDGLRENLAMARQSLAEQQIAYEGRLRDLSERLRDALDKCEGAARAEAAARQSLAHLEPLAAEAQGLRENLAMARQALTEQKPGYERALQEVAALRCEVDGLRENLAMARQALAEQRLVYEGAHQAMAALRCELDGVRENLAMARQARAEQQIAYENKLQDFSRHYQQMAHDRDEALAHDAVARHELVDAYGRLVGLREEIQRERQRLAAQGMV